MAWMKYKEAYDTIKKCTVKIYTIEIDSSFFFGKHKGKTTEEIIEEDVDYLVWLYEKSESHVFTDEVKEAMQIQLDKNAEQKFIWAAV